MDKLSKYIKKNPLTALGIFIIFLPITYSICAGIFNWAFPNSQIIFLLLAIGFLVIFFGEKYENKNKDDE